MDELQACKRSVKLLFQVSCATHLQHTVVELVTRFMNHPSLDLLHRPSTESILRRSECYDGPSSFGSLVEDGANPSSSTSSNGPERLDPDAEFW